jgi:hypothetical protein
MPRPDRAHYVLDMMPDAIKAINNDTGEAIEIIVIQVWVDGSFARALADRALWRYAERLGEEGRAIILRNGSTKARIMFPPAMASDNRWHLVDDSQVTIVPDSGNRLLEELRSANLEPV